MNSSPPREEAQWFDDAAPRASPEQCPHWRGLPGTSNEARCELLVTLLGREALNEARVSRDLCAACCQTFMPTLETLNPVVASRVYNSASAQLKPTTPAEATAHWQSLVRWSERFLDIDSPPLPPLATSLASSSTPIVASESLRTALPPLSQLVPWPTGHGGAAIRHWSVGVTTAPRRRPRLAECLHSLAAAGWPRPHLFVDGLCDVPREFATLPRTTRRDKVGAWPNFYLALIELLMRDPLADAYLMVQDDAWFYDRENLREYLEAGLWPGSRPGVVSLYCASPDTRAEPGWATYQGVWKFGAVAFLFPREIAQQLVIAPPVFRHRWQPDDEGLVGVCDVVGAWAVQTNTPVYYPSPSLVQHIGDTSAIWLGSYDLPPQRRADSFVGNVVPVAPPVGRHATKSIHPAQESQLPTAASFPEERFPCSPAWGDDYRQRVDAGFSRLAETTAVICGLCRDVASALPQTIARLERLAASFRDVAIVIFENDSDDDTPHLLQQWAARDPRVEVLSAALGQPRFLGGTSRARTERMAYYRNRCRQQIAERHAHRDVVVVADMDLAGGWSYDGIAHTFGHEEWDFVGSNGLLFQSTDGAFTRLHYDSFAYRPVGNDRLSRDPSVQQLRWERGEPLAPVWSCFGGLGIYRMAGFLAATYAGEDCEHVTFHRALRNQGFGRLFLNPSQIVLYSSQEVLP